MAFNMKNPLLNGSAKSRGPMQGNYKRSMARQDDENIKGSKFTSAIDQISNNPNLTDDEIRAIVVDQRRGEGGKATSKGVNLSYKEALSLRNEAKSKQPKETTAPPVKPVESPPTTIAEQRQDTYHEGSIGTPGYFTGIADPRKDPVRREAIKRDAKSGYTQKLMDALDREYGAGDDDYGMTEFDLGERLMKGDITKEQYQRAQYQMVDPESGELLPMSSASGQTSYDYSEQYPDDKPNPAIVKNNNNLPNELKNSRRITDEEGNLVFQMKKKKAGMPMKKGKRGFQMKRKK